MDIAGVKWTCPFYPNYVYNYYFISYINYAHITSSVIPVITGPCRLGLKEEVNYVHITSSVISKVVRHKLCPYYLNHWGNMDTYENISFLSQPKTVQHITEFGCPIRSHCHST